MSISLISKRRLFAIKNFPQAINPTTSFIHPQVNRVSFRCGHFFSNQLLLNPNKSVDLSSQHVEITSVLDKLSKFRISNFFKRISQISALNDQENGELLPIVTETVDFKPISNSNIESSGSDLLFSSEIAKSEKKIPFRETTVLCRAEILLPLEIYESPTNRTKIKKIIRATGFATDKNDAIIAACMHAERILDAFGIPIFLLQSSQMRHAAEAKKLGRFAPNPGEEPFFREDASYPEAVLFNSLVDKSPPKKSNYNDPFGSLKFPTSTSSKLLCSSTVSKSSSAAFAAKKPMAPWKIYRCRFHQDPFWKITRGNDINLINNNFDLSENLRDESFSKSSIIDDDIEILSPESWRSEKEWASSTWTIKETKFVSDSSSVPYVALQRPTSLNERCCYSVQDESENESYNLVECHSEWELGGRPTSPALLDRFALKRLDSFFSSSLEFGDKLENCISTTVSVEMTQIMLSGPEKFEEKTWYISQVAIPSYPSLFAKGKATTYDLSVQLCAQHAERILEALGVLIYPDDPKQQELHMDSCKCYGRPYILRSQPLSPNELQEVRIPKPLKEFLLVNGKRRRRSPFSIHEKLLAFNRKVVSIFRMHIIEKDPIDMDVHLRESVDAIRSYLVSQQHPFESAWFNLVYSKDSNYRCSLYLPLPGEYGIRGAFAIASTPTLAIQLCAVHAIDVLCSFNIPVFKDIEKQRNLEETRVKLGLIPRMPCMHTQMRSPPGYRQHPGDSPLKFPPSEELWCIMLMDAKDFDVVELKEHKNTPCSSDRNLAGSEEGASMVTNSDQNSLSLADLCHLVELFLSWFTSEEEQKNIWYHTYHYQGFQILGKRLTTPANTYWFSLPIDPAIYNKRVAVGRCLTRRGGLRMMLIHCLRLIHRFNLMPHWNISQHTSSNASKTNAIGSIQHLSRGKSLQQVKGNTRTNVKSELGSAQVFRLWSLFCEKYIISDGSNTVFLNHITDIKAQNKSANTDSIAKYFNVLSPYPVMSGALAKATYN